MKLGILINFVITVGIPLLLETIKLDIQIILEVIPKDIEIVGIKIHYRLSTNSYIINILSYTVLR